MAYDFDLIVIGGGAAGLTSSGLGVSLGASTLMVESERLGGDCTWYGCVPSKTILKGAKVAHQVRSASKYGLVDQEITVPFGRIMDYVRHVREEVYEEADRPEIFENLGVTVEKGHASFIDDHTIEVAGPNGVKKFTGKYFVIATGAKAFVPPIPGLEDVPHVTNETLFELTEQPKRLGIVGGGPIGTEMAQAFARLGSNVTVMTMGDRLLEHDDPEFSKLVLDSLTKDGVSFSFGANVSGLRKDGSETVITVKTEDAEKEVRCDMVLVATGRRANIHNLNLEGAGVETWKKGVQINDKCRTNRRHIYAIGDVTGVYQFTHMSEHMAKVAVTNALVKLPMKIDHKHVPWVTYTDPEVAHVGMTLPDLEKSGKKFRTYKFPYNKIDRAITDSETGGWIKVHARERDGKIYGVDIGGAAAGELICEYAVAMKNGVTLRNIADTIHPYPTYALGARRAADQWYVQKQSPTLVKWIKRIFRYRGPVLEFGSDDIL